MVLAAMPAWTQQSTQLHKTTTATSVKPTVEMAKWHAEAQQAFGLTEEIFRDAGLHKLTRDEYVSLLTWIAGQSASRTEAATSQVETISCGRPFSPTESYDKVRVFLDFSERSPSEFVSGVREQFRNKRDVEVVFDRKDADVSARILAFYNESQSGYRTGITVSVVTLESCKDQIKAFKYDGTFDKYLSHYLNTAPDAQGAIDQTVTAIDANDIEDARQTNAMFKKAAEPSKTHYASTSC